MNTQNLDSSEIRKKFKEIFEKSSEEEIEHRAQMLSYIFLSEIEKALDRKGWTRKQLADRIGTSASYLTQLFRGDRLLNLKTIGKMEAALHLEFKIIEVTNPGEGDKNTSSRMPRKKISIHPTGNSSGVL